MLAQRLTHRPSVAGVPAEGIATTRALLDNDNWRLIPAARQAEDDEAFAAIFAKLSEA